MHRFCLFLFLFLFISSPLFSAEFSSNPRIGERRKSVAPNKSAATPAHLDKQTSSPNLRPNARLGPRSISPQHAPLAVPPTTPNLLLPLESTSPKGENSFPASTFLKLNILSKREDVGSVYSLKENEKFPDKSSPITRELILKNLYWKKLLTNPHFVSLGKPYCESEAEKTQRVINERVELAKCNDALILLERHYAMPESEQNQLNEDEYAHWRLEIAAAAIIGKALDPENPFSAFTNPDGPLERALRNHDINLVEWLLFARAHGPLKQKLFMAQTVRLAELIVNIGQVKPSDEKSSDGSTPLHRAMDPSCDPQLVRYYHEMHNVNALRFDNQHRTPVHLWAQYVREYPHYNDALKRIEWLFSLRSNKYRKDVLDARDNSGKTAYDLLVASPRQHPLVTKACKYLAAVMEFVKDADEEEVHKTSPHAASAFMNTSNSIESSPKSIDSPVENTNTPLSYYAGLSYKELLAKLETEG